MAPEVSSVVEQLAALARCGRLREAAAQARAWLAEPANADAEARSPLRAQVLAHLAQMTLVLGEGREVLRLAEEAEALAVEAGDAATAGRARCWRCMAYDSLGLSQEVAPLAQQVLTDAERLGDLPLQALALRALAKHLDNLGVHADALDALARARALAEAAGATEDAFWALNDMIHTRGVQAEACRAAGDGVGASYYLALMRPMLQQAHALAGVTGHPLQLAYAIANEADVYIVQGQHAAARLWIARYATLAREHGYGRLQGYAALDLARMAAMEGQHAQALQALEGDEHGAIAATWDDLNLATERARYAACKALGHYAQALAHLEATNETERRLYASRAELSSRSLLARLELAQAKADAEHARAEVVQQRLAVHELESDRLRLHQQANEDALTGLPNRRAANEALAGRLRLAAAAGQAPSPWCVVLLDIDHFKQVNDRHGHAVGDQVLLQVGSVLRSTLRGHDEVFRFGGEEFLLLLHGATAEVGLAVCERVRRALAGHAWQALGPGLHVTASLGLAAACGDESALALVARADAALYTAKRSGRNRVQIAPLRATA